VAVDAPMDLNFAAFVWDKSTSAERRMLERDWRQWWSYLLEDRPRQAEGRVRVTDHVADEAPGFDALASPLQAACQRTWADFRSWWGPHDGIGRAQQLLEAGTVDIGALVRSIERGRDTPARPFSVAIDVVERASKQHPW
jgi:hypothetical protein